MNPVHPQVQAYKNSRFVTSLSGIPPNRVYKTPDKSTNTRWLPLLTMARRRDVRSVGIAVYLLLARRPVRDCLHPHILFRRARAPCTGFPNCADVHDHHADIAHDVPRLQLRELATHDLRAAHGCGGAHGLCRCVRDADTRVRGRHTDDDALLSPDNVVRIL